DLDMEVQKKKEMRTSLVNQRRKLSLELSNWERKKQDSQASHKRKKDEIHCVGLEIAACQESLRNSERSKGNLMLREDVVLLDVTRLRDELRHSMEKVVKFEREWEKVERSMKVSQLELLSAIKMSRAECRAADEERHRLAIELGHRKLRVEKLQSKYSTLVQPYCPNEAGDIHSPLFRLRGADQEREELQLEGYRLVREIQCKEKDVLSMQVTLHHLRQRNTAFRLSFAKAYPSRRKAEESLLIKNSATTDQEPLVRMKRQHHTTEENINVLGKRLNVTCTKPLEHEIGHGATRSSNDKLPLGDESHCFNAATKRMAKTDEW
ncbi:MAG: hypothetical protein ACRDL7_16555, partial [Gaiellaceae bacterium]